MAGPVVKAIITTLDNLPLLREQVRILKDDPLIDEIIVVCNGSKDGTREWLMAGPSLSSCTPVLSTDPSLWSWYNWYGEDKLIITVDRENRGAGPGRNAGIDAAGEFDYALFLDGGIRPLIGGTEKMLDYLERIPEADVIGVEIPDFETDYDKAWRRWPDPIEYTYQNTRLSHTAYCLTRACCWEGLRFCEEGPFGEPGWGVDDDEMAAQWALAGIIVHVVSCQCNRGKPCTGVHPYRRASGSFNRLFQETGIWPNQFGSVYEKRLVWMQQKYPQLGEGTMWGAPEIVVVVKVTTVEQTAKTIKAAHDEMRKRKQEPPWDHVWLPYHVVAWGDCEGWAEWAEPRRLRQHQGDKIVVDGQIVKRNKDNRDTWTGDFIFCQEEDYSEAVWPGAEVVVVECERDVQEGLIVERDGEKA